MKGTQIFFGYFAENLSEEKIKEKKILLEDLDECDNGIIKKLMYMNSTVAKKYETKVSVKECNL